MQVEAEDKEWLVSQAREGNFDPLLNHISWKWRKRIFSVIISKFGISQASDVGDDVVQDVLIAVWERLLINPEFLVGGASQAFNSLWRYIFQVIKTKALDRIGKWDGSKNIRWKQPGDIFPQSKNIEKSDREISAKKLFQAIENRGGKLAKEMRKVLELAYRKPQLSLVQICKKLKFGYQKILRQLDKDEEFIRQKCSECFNTEDDS